MKAIVSPCINICLLHPDSGLCVGCKRTIEEIAGWTGFSDEERRRILDELPKRRVDREDGLPG